MLALDEGLPDWTGETTRPSNAPETNSMQTFWIVKLDILCFRTTIFSSDTILNWKYNLNQGLVQELKKPRN